MLNSRVMKGFALGAITLFSATFLTDCTSMITEEQMAQLQDLRERQANLENEISQSRSMLNKLKSELDARKAELNNCNEDKEFVTNKLSQWPNVWSD